MKRGKRRAVQLWERDRHLCAVLAHARWLTGEQLQRLMFPGRDERDFRRRLHELSVLPRGVALLKRNAWLSRDGLTPVWGLTAAGYREAELLLDEELTPPPIDFEPETMAHHVQLTELYVGLLAAQVEPRLAQVPPNLSPADRRKALAGLYARALHRSWRWTVVGDGVVLPWKVHEDGRARDRVLKPDAVLELPAERRRLFLEAETGSHTVVPRHGDNKPNSTLSKLDRYEAYLTGAADASRRSWYQAKYADGFAPELWFLVHSERRAATVTAALGAWRQKHPGAVLDARALTLASALAELGGVAPVVREKNSGAGRGGFVLSAEEAAALVRLVYFVRKEFKERQAVAIDDGLPAPAAPPGYELLKPVIARLFPTQSAP